jgi:phosphoribosylformylglycinamidine cyclo-ligase
MLPIPCKAVIDRSTWSPPPIFSYLQEAGQISDQEMLRTFNNGLGLVIVVNEEETDEVLLRLKAMGETACLIGSVESRDDTEEAVQFEGSKAPF